MGGEVRASVTSHLEIRALGVGVGGAVEDLVGPGLVCGRGVVVAGHLTADPDADVRLVANGRELVFGRHRLELPRRLPDEFPELRKKWLRFRAEGLLPFIDGYLAPGSADVARRVLGPFCRRCLACGHIGCCDNSPGRHASAHARSTSHPLVQSFEPGEEWIWCYADEVGVEIEGAPPSPSRP